MRHLTIALASALIALALPANAAAPQSAATATAKADEAPAVRAAVLDYVEAFYNGQPERARRSVAPELTKIGHYQNRAGQSVWAAMSYDELLDLAARYPSIAKIPADAPKVIELLDVGTRIANAKLTAMWGVDYLLLTKGADGQWKIRQVVWEAPPRQQ